jgi:hypothetical protein
MSGPRRFLVRSVQFGGGGLVVEYLEPSTDLKSNGVSLTKLLYVPDEPDYADGIEGVLEAAEELLVDVLVDVRDLGPPTQVSYPGDRDDDEDDESERNPFL